MNKTLVALIVVAVAGPSLLSQPALAATPHMGSPEALSASIQDLVGQAAPAISSPELVQAMKSNSELELTSAQQQAIETIMLENAQSLQIILDGFRVNLETLVEKIKYDIYPVLSSRQQDVMKRLEAVQTAELNLLKAKMELDLSLKHKSSVIK